jgi:hypothetical protein
MTDQDVRKLALSLPEAEELPHMQRTSFRVRNKIFATMSEDRTEAVVFVAPRERLYELASEHPQMFRTLGGWSRLGALGVVLAKADRLLFEELLVASWRKRAPKRAIAAYEGKAGKAGRK